MGVHPARIHNGRSCRERLSSSKVGVGEIMMHLMRALVVVVSASLAAVGWTAPALAQIADRCLAVSQGPPLVQPAALRLASLAPSEVRLTFVGHATWLIESAGGVKIATDYNDYIRPPVVPDIATMNRAHTTHYSIFPDPAIKHVLRGWDPDGGVARHDL